jgi:4-hydroxythreonine-4-phosphate dehydrogenase
LTIAEPWTDAPLALALGDPAGIGPEIAVKAWLARTDERLPPFLTVGDIRSVEAIWSGPVERIASPAEALDVFDRALPLLSVEDGAEIAPGEPNLEGARCSLDSL